MHYLGIHVISKSFLLGGILVLFACCSRFTTQPVKPVKPSDLVWIRSNLADFEKSLASNISVPLADDLAGLFSVSALLIYYPYQQVKCASQKLLLSPGSVNPKG